MSETATLKIWRGADQADGPLGKLRGAVRARPVGARRAALDPGQQGPSLAIRFSCINANACKECMMELDGETVYACTARLEPREMRVAPLSNKKLVRDLVTEIAPPAERFAAEGEMMTIERKPVAFGDMRNWMKALKTAGELHEIDAEVDWNVELGTITRLAQGPGTGPALLFNNIKDYNKNNTRCRAVFAGGLGSYRRVAMMMGLPPDTHPRELVKIGRTILEGSIPPQIVKDGPVQGEHRHRQGHRPLRVSGAAVEPARRRPLHRSPMAACVTKDPTTGVHERRRLSRHGSAEGPHPDPDVARAAHRPPRHRLAERRQRRRCRSRSRSAGSRRSPSPAARRCRRACANTTSWARSAARRSISSNARRSTSTCRPPPRS